MLLTTEAQLVGSVFSSGQSDDKPVALAEYDPEAEAYTWMQVIHHVFEYNSRKEVALVYTPDCSKMLTFYTMWNPVAHKGAYLAYLNVEDGSV